MGQLQTTSQGTNLPAEINSAWGAEEVDKSDILIPKLLIGQGLSKFVTEEKCRQGEIVDSVSLRVLGKREGPASTSTSVPVIPIMTFKYWKISHKGPKDTKFKFVKITPYDQTNADQDWEVALADGITERRDMSLGFYVLNANDVGRPEALPYLLSFSRSSYREGRRLSTHFAQCNMAKVPPAKKVFNLSCHKETKDNNDYWVFDVSESRDSSTPEVAAAFAWYKELRAGGHKIDTSDEEVVVAPQAQTVTEVDQY